MRTKPESWERMLWREEIKAGMRRDWHLFEWPHFSWNILKFSSFTLLLYLVNAEGKNLKETEGMDLSVSFSFQFIGCKGKKKLKAVFQPEPVSWSDVTSIFFFFCTGGKKHTQKKHWLNHEIKITGTQKNIHTLLTHTDNADKHTVYHLLQLWCYCSAVTLAGVISATTLHGQIWLHLFSQEGVIRKQQCMALNIRFIYKNVSFRGFSFNYQDKIFLILLIWRKES